MGIKYFFSYFKNKFNNRISTVKREKNIVQKNDVIIDNFLLDMNGIFHNCAQKVYEYGNYKGLKNLFGDGRKTKFNKQKRFFAEVCNYIEMLFDMVEPQKRLVMCVDGVAPLSKQSQQRSRRFKSSLERKDDDESFDPNCLTPGTQIMDYLTKYIDWFIHKKMTEDERWNKIEVIFSNEKNPGEGEHKLINFIKKYGNENESYMIQGMDADLIMLSLSTNRDKFWILREDHRSVKGDFFLINVENFKSDVLDQLFWGIEGKPFNAELAIYDFILMCFSIGNDFLPNIPTIEILDGGMELMFETYKNVGKTYGHLVNRKKEGLQIQKKALEVFFGTLAQYENQVLNNKVNNKIGGYTDSLLNKYAILDEKESKYEVDMKKYMRAYYRKKLNALTADVSTICHDYLKGLTWILEYYTSGLPSWNWFYPHHYAPFLSDIAKNIYNFPEVIKWGKTNPISPFLQLLCVLPTKSSNLLPSPLNKLLDSDSVISEFYPEEFEIDLEGKRNDWEGVPILPFVDLKRVNDAYYELINDVKENEKKRNKLGRCFIYKKTDPYLFKSYNGDIRDCSVNTEFINI